MKSTIRRRLVGTVFLLLASTSAPAQDFFLTTDFGYSGISYGSNATLQDFKTTQQADTTRHLPLAIDIAVLTETVDPGTVAGLGYDGILDLYSRNGAGNRAAINQTCIVGTLRHFFGSAVGQGPFLRGDVGIDFVSASTTSTNNIFNSSSSTSSTSHGLILLGGGGYGFPVSEHMSFTAQGNYGTTFLSSGAIHEWQPKVGVFISL